MASVTLADIKKMYDNNVVAVQDLSFKVADKEFIVLVGPSGCGKSTTLRMIAGLEEISEGTLYIDDAVVNDTPPKDRDIAMVFQNYALYPHMTVFENMAFALKLQHVNKKDIARRVGEAAEILNITELLQRKPKALSGGQRQRVAIGRAIVREPKVFLMDEPLSNLDAKLRNQMRAEIIKLHQRLNTTFIYVTHDQTEAMTLGDRIIVMKDGLAQQIGAPQEVFDRPANLFVAGFIGTPQMNTFDGRLVKEQGKYAVTLQDLKIGLTDEMNAILAGRNTEEQNIQLGIRPEHLSLADPGEAGAVTVKIDISEMMGSETHLHLSLNSQDLVLRIPTLELNQYLQKTAGQSTISIQFPNTLIHLFSAESGKNLVY